MILAAPLVIPFSKAVPALAGLTGMLGMAALSEKVNEYIQENPEESMKILSTIIPNIGIGQIFMSKEDKISLEDLDEMTDEEAQDLSKEEKAELMKQAGKKRNRELSIATSEKIGLSGPGKEKQDIEYEIDERYDEGGVEEKKAPFDYTKFFRKRRADGGSIGIEVLFEPKRKDFNIGGRATRVTPYDARASVQDFTNALQSVSAGTTYQQQAQAKDYARQQASSMLNQAMKSADPNKGPGLQGIYDTFFKNKNTGIGPSTFTPGASGRMMSYSSRDKDRILDQMANQMLNTTNYSQSKVNERREKEYADFMNNLITSTYGKAGDYKAEAMTLNMPTEAYFDYLVTSDPKDKLSTRDVLSRDPYFDPKTYVPTDYSNPETPRPPSPYEVYYQQELKNQISAGIPVGQRIQQGQVMGLPTLAGPGSQMGPGYEAYADVVARNKKMLGLKDGGRVGLFMGGDPLTGQALAIYNSMNAYGFSDQEIANALEGQGLYTAGGTTDTPDTTIQPIGFQSGNGGGGGGITELDPLNRPKGTPFDLNSLTKTKFGYNNALGRTIEGVKDFTGSMIDKFSGSKIGEGITEGATKFKNFAITPMMALMQKRNPLNPDAMNYNPNLQKQMDFLEGQTGTKITGTSGNLKFTDDQMMIGTDPNSGLAKYGPGSVLEGQNVVSGFGTNDYEEQLGKYIEKMRNRAITKTLSKFQQEKLDAAMAELGREKARQEKDAADRARAANADVYAELDKRTGGKGYGDAGGFSTSRVGKEGAFGTFGEGRGRKDYSKGGLATMFKEKR